jgi:ribose-phosphate pyrophosphokinase
MGGAKRAKNYAGHLGAEVVIAYKKEKSKCCRRNVPYW